MKDVNKKLQEGLSVSQGDIRMHSEDSNDIDEAERPEWNEIARKKVKKKLEAEGFNLQKGLENILIFPV